jgi:hypothetical protein
LSQKWEAKHHISKMSNDCSICCSSFNLTTRKLVNCPYCTFSACRTCCETYVLGESTVRCMNNECAREWTRQHIVSVFTGTFINGKLKKHREDLLYDNERALLPATQPIVERAIAFENITVQQREIRQQIRDLRIRSIQLNTQLYNMDRQPVASQRAEFVRACPDEECRGFLSTQWKCGLCQKWACPDCHEVKGLQRDVEHVCNPDVLATARLLANDTRPCPSCRTGIFKIDGCDQMWCTQCHTAFNWRTGRVEQVVHNPHYFEWLRRNGTAIPRNPGDIPCQNALTHQTFTGIRTLLQTRHRTHAFSVVCETMLGKIVRNTLHLAHAVLPMFREQNRVQRNEHLRVQYMRKLITAEQFKVTLQRNDKKAEKNREIYNILDVLRNTITDIVFRFYAHLETCSHGGWSLDIFDEIDPIVDYTNDCLHEISRTYKCKRMLFNNEIVQKL